VRDTGGLRALQAGTGEPTAGPRSLCIPLKAVPTVWIQVYDPLGSWPVSTLLAALPVLILLGLLVSGRANAWQAALAGLLSALTIAITLFGMPLTIALAAATFGAVFALFRILWLVLAAVYLYDLSVVTGQFDIMKRSVARLSPDRRVQAILIAFSFGAFVEGAAGFGAPVAISAAFLVGLGFAPMKASILCLIANTAPVAWGALGTPIKTLAIVTGLDLHALSATSGRILPPVSLIIPLWLVRSMVPWRRTAEVWPALLAVGGSFALAQWFWSNYVGVDLVDLVSSIVSLLCGVVLLRFWKPRHPYRFPEEVTNPNDFEPLSARDVARAWMPFGLLCLFVLIWGLPEIPSLGLPSVKSFLDQKTSINPPMPGLHLKVAKGAAVTGHPDPLPADLEKALLDIVPVSSTGTAVFLAAVISGLALGLSPAQLSVRFLLTFRRLLPALGAILLMLALGFVTKFAGLDAVLGLALTRTGPWLYPVFGTLLGWLGVALTGSDTSSNVLFGNLQTITARKLGLDPVLMAAANSTGGVMGKMIDAQSIVVAAAACGEVGREGIILRKVFWHSLALALIVGGIVWVFAHITPNVVVKGLGNIP
jgi:lactate permease